jgi:hypothetical protein
MGGYIFYEVSYMISVVFDVDWGEQLILPTPDLGLDSACGYGSCCQLIK